MPQVTHSTYCVAALTVASLLVACSSAAPVPASQSRLASITVAASGSWTVGQLATIAKPIGIAFARNALYVTQRKGEQVKQIKRGQVFGIGGDVYMAHGVAAANGNVYIADTGHSQVKEIDRNGEVHLLGSGWLGPYAIAVGLHDAGSVWWTLSA